MNRLQLLFYPKEVQHLILELDLLWKKYDSDEFMSTTSCVPILKPQIDLAIKKNKSDIANVLRNGTKPSIMALTMIANLAGDWLETGKYHIYFR